MMVTLAPLAGRRGNACCFGWPPRLALGLLAILLFPSLASALITTATTLSGPSGTVTSGTAITLTAYVHASAGGPYGGQVAFCDSVVAPCTDIHRLGTAALLAGYADFKFTPGPGAHSYKAVYIGNTSFAASTSALLAVTVTPFRAAVTSISPSGSPGSYAEISAVSGAGSVPPTGTVSYLDTSNANYVLGSATLGGGSSSLTLNTGTNCFTGSGSGASAIVTGDFNRDGLPDFAVANTSTNTLTICLVHRDGTFTTLTQSLPASANRPNSLAVGDFNNDGIPDLIVGTGVNIPGYYASMTLLKGNGDGTFTAGTTLRGAFTTFSPVVGDFDGDGNLDVAFLGNDVSSSSIFIYHGYGDDTFASLPTINQPQYTFYNSLVAADLNNDGRTDLVYTIQGNTSLTVEFGNSDETFMAKAPVVLAGIPAGSIGVADFNGDGNLDLAVAQGGSIAILKGKGDGTFTSGTPVNLPSPPLFVAVADVNGDGKADLAVALNVAGNNVLVATGNGDGTFSSTQVTDSLTYYGGALATGDFNADGFTDLAVVNGDNATLVIATPQTSATATGSVLSPVGTGTHQIVASYPGDANFAASTSPSSGLMAFRVSGQAFTLSASPASSVAGQPVTLTATINPSMAQGHSTDGERVTFSLYPGGRSIGTASLLSGVATLTLSTLPAGTSTLEALYPGDANFYSQVTNDLLYTVASSTSTSLAVLSGGTAVSSVPAGSAITLTATVLSGSASVSPGLVAFCDAAAPHCTDVHRLGTAQLTASGTATLRITPAIGVHSYKAVFLGTAAAIMSSSPAAALTVTGLFPTVTTLASNGSPGNYTLAASIVSLTRSPLSGTVSFIDTTNGNAVLGSAAIPFSSSTFAFGNGQTLATGSQPKAVATGDFNGDGKADFITANYGASTLTVELGNGDGTFTTGPTISSSIASPVAIALGDFNGDGKQDLAVANYGGPSVSILLGNGDGTFTAGTSFFVPSPQALVVGDFNNDGIADLAVASAYANNTVYVRLGRGDGTFTAPSGSTLTAGNYPASIVTADFNNDGFQDIAVANVTDRTITIFFGSGGGQFSSSRTIANAGSSYALATADLDGDGNADLIALDSGGNTVTVLRGDGTGAFTALASPVSSVNPLALAVGDLNGDGIPDIVTVAGSASMALDVFFGNGDGTFQAAMAYGTGVLPQSLALADFNGDGWADLVTASFGGNNASVLLAQTTQVAIVSAVGISPTGPGARHAVQATYPGDTTHAASTSNFVSLAPLPYAAAPTFSPAAGTYTSAQTVTLSTATAGATMYYTTDGSAPTAASPRYSAPLSVTSPETLRAFAVASGYQDSPVSSAIYTINYPATITTQPASQTINSGNSVNLTVSATGTAPLNYQWFNGTSPSTASPIAGATSSVYITPNLTATASFWVQVSNASGVPANSATATITVIEPPSITTQPASQTINSGSSATLTVSAAGTAPLIYQWFSGASPNTASPIAGATSSAYVTPNLTATSSFWVQVGNASAVPSNSSTATITVITPPAIVTPPASQTINSGSAVTLSVVASGTAPLTYQWLSGASSSSLVPIPAATNSSYATSPLTATTYFQVQVRNSSGVPASAIATITVVSRPVITLQPASQTINSGNSATLSVAVSGTNPALQWYAGASGNTASPVAGATNLSYTTQPLTATSSFWVRASNQAGSADSATATVTVIGTPVCSLTVQPTATALAVVATTRCGDPQNQALSTALDWGDGSAPVATAATATSTHTYAKAGVYAVTVTAKNGSGLTGSATVRVSPNQSPVCTLGVVQGQISTVLTQYPVTVSGGCTDPQGQPLTLSLDWGDGSVVTPGAPPYMHTYKGSSTVTYNVVLTASDSAGLTGSSAPQPVQIVPALPIPAGGSADVSSSILPPPLAAPASTQVTFLCSSVSVQVNGLTVTTLPSAYGITCTSPTIPLTSAPIPVDVSIFTSNGVAALVRPPRLGSGLVLCGVAFPFVSWVLLLPVSAARRRRFTGLALACVICLSLSACGGSFRAPVTAATPSGLYYITLVETIVNPPAPTGFVQTSLIVPLPVTH